MNSNPTAPSGVEWDASSYHRIADPQFAWGRKILDTLALHGDETALDAGCGSGRLTALLLERLPRGHVIAVDRSANMLQTARAELLPRFGDRVSFQHTDLQTLAVASPVDLIFSTSTLHWIPDHPRLFAHLYRALRPGGWLVAECGGGPTNLARLLARAHALLAAPSTAPYVAGWPGPWEFADDAVTSARLRAAGFADITTSLESTPTVLPGPAAYREFLATVTFRLHLERLPDQRLRDAFLDALTQQAAHDDPPYLLDFWRLNLRARRPA